MVEQSTVLGLSIVVALQDDGNENFQEDQVYHEGVAHKVHECQTLAPASHRLIVVINKIQIIRVVNALSVGSTLHRIGLHYVIPGVSRGHNEQCNEAVIKILKVHIVVHDPRSHCLSEKDHPQYRVHEYEQQQQATNVCQGMQCDYEGIEDQLETFTASD